MGRAAGAAGRGIGALGIAGSQVENARLEEREYQQKAEEERKRKARAEALQNALTRSEIETNARRYQPDPPYDPATDPDILGEKEKKRLGLGRYHQEPEEPYDPDNDDQIQRRRAMIDAGLMRDPNAPPQESSGEGRAQARFEAEQARREREEQRERLQAEIVTRLARGRQRGGGPAFTQQDFNELAQKYPGVMTVDQMYQYASDYARRTRPDSGILDDY